MEKISNKTLDRNYGMILGIAVLLFLSLNAVNNNYPAYKQADTYKYITALDDVVDKPTKYNQRDLEEFHFNEEDIILMKARYLMDEHYITGDDIVLLAERIKSTRSFNELRYEILKFAQDERYMLLIYLISAGSVFFFAARARSFMFLNMAVALALLLYLASTIRIPHRVTFPLLIYISSVNLYIFLKEKDKLLPKNGVLALLLLLGGYKFYCVTRLAEIHLQNHKIFTRCLQEVQKHPDHLFIALYDGFPVEYMNAKTPPDSFKLQNNLILTGWNVWAPDFKQVLRHHRLKDIAGDLRSRKEVLFLTNKDDFQKAFIAVMQRRYGLVCHFEPVKEDFQVLQPKRLVFDN